VLTPTTPAFLAPDAATLNGNAQTIDAQQESDLSGHGNGKLTAFRFID